MEYFVSHLGIIIIAAAFVAVCAVAWWYLTERNAMFVAVCAVAWWYLTERNAMLIRQRAEARRKAASASVQTKSEDADKHE